MTRFFVRPEQIENSVVTLEADDAHHLRAVLKANPGNRIAVLDGTGREYAGILETVGKTKATARLKPPTFPQTEPRTKVTVAQALPKVADKMEQVLQRGTEIGAAAFWAFAGERSLPHLTGERHAKRIGRWEAIIKTAAEQSRRALLPSVRADQNVESVLQAANGFDLALLAYEGERKTMLRDALAADPAPRSLLVLVGPEGGFTDAEVAAARRAGVRSISLGPRILRTETAALVLLAQILYALE